MTSSPMNDGVALLLERMKTHPEEFGVRDGKWTSLINNYIMHLEKEDRDALNEGMDKLMQQRFTEKIMEELIDPKKSSLEELMLRAQQNAIHASGKTPIQYTADELMNAHIDEHKKALGLTPIAGVTQTL